MASVLNKDPFTYAEDRQRFLQDLHRFHASRGTPFDRIPQIGGREVDLYRLYRRVIDLGGWQKLNNEQLWEDILEEFKLPVTCTNATQALKYIYFRYLNIYEKVHFLGVDPDQAEEDTEDGPARKKVCLPIESVPLSYNYAQHRVQDNVRATQHLETNLLRHSEYEKLEMALRSGLPNEVDFAVNVCLLLSNEGRHVLKLGKSSHLVPLLLANIGIFDEGPATLEDVMLHSWRTSSKRDFLRFWHETVRDQKMREFIKTKDGVYTRRDLLGHEVLSLGRDHGVSDAEGQRVTQLAVLIRNLSFEEINQPCLASSALVFRFLMLCIHSSYGSLHQLALDTLGNLASQLVLEPRDSMTTQLVLNLIKTSLVQEDKFATVRALEILSKLCQLERNESVLNECLEADTYDRIVQLLTVHDIQLIVHTLEALYQLSELGDTTTSMIADVRNAVDLLVNLITVEAQSYGPNSLIGIKVVEYVPPPELANSGVPPSQVVHHSHVMQSVAPSHPYNYPMQPPPAVPQHLTAEQQKADVETTASNWLQGTFEMKKGSCVTQSDLFADYQQFCRKFSVPDSLTSSDFLTVVKSAFPQVDVANVEKADGEKDVVIKSLSKRAIPRPFAIHTGSDKVSKPCSVTMNSPRGPPLPAGTANWSQLGISTSMVSPYAMAAPSPPIHTPTLRKRLMEPPRMALHHQIVNPTGTTAVGAPPSSIKPVIVSSTSRPPQPLAPKPPDSGGSKSGQKKRQITAAPPPGPGPGPGTPATSLRPPGLMTPRPAMMANMVVTPRSVLQQHLQVAGAPQPAASVMLPATTDHVVIQSSSTPLLTIPATAPTTLPSSCSPSPALIATQSTTTTSMPNAASVAVSVTTTTLATTSAPLSSPGQQFPLIHQALQGEGPSLGAGGRQALSQAADQNDTMLIKSLLAKKVCQNMVRQGGSTPSHSPPPQDGAEPMEVSQALQEAQQPTGQQQQFQQPQQQTVPQQMPQESQQQQQPLPHPQMQANQLKLSSSQPAQQPVQQVLQIQQSNSQLVLQQQPIHQQPQAQQPQQPPHQLQQQPQQLQQQPQQLQQQPQQLQQQQPQQLQQQSQTMPHQLPQPHQLTQQVQIQLQQKVQPQTLQLQPQQLLLQAQPQQQQTLQLRPQQLILQQHLPHQQQLVIQSQPTLQQILHQPLQQLHIQSQSQTLQIQAQSQPLQIQSQSRPLQLQAHSQPLQSQSQPLQIQSQSQPLQIQSQSQPLQIQAQSQPLHIQAQSQPLQIQAQSQPLQIQTQGQQQPQQAVTFQIQLPLYSLPQISSTQIGSVSTFCTTLVHNPVVQTVANTSPHLTLPQSSSGPYRTIIPNPSTTISSSLSSQRPLAPSPGPAGHRLTLKGRNSRPSSPKLMIKTSQGQGSGAESPLSIVEGELSRDSSSEELTDNKQVQESLRSTLQCALTAPSLSPQTFSAATSRTVQPARDMAVSPITTDQSNPAIARVQNPLTMSGGVMAHAPFRMPGVSSLLPSTNPSVPSAAASLSLPSSHLSAPHLPMSLTQAILTGNTQDVSAAGNMPSHTVPHLTESQVQPSPILTSSGTQAGMPALNMQHQAGLDNGHHNMSGSMVVSQNKECNGLTDSGAQTVEANGILGSPDSASSELPPSPTVEGMKKGMKTEQHVPNGLMEDSINSLKECARSKDLLNIVVEKAAKVNGLVHHMENGEVEKGLENMDTEEWRVPKMGEKVHMGDAEMELESKSKGKSVQCNGDLEGSGDGVKVEHGITAPIPHRDREQVFAKQTSMEEVSMDSTDLQMSISTSKLLVNGSKSCDGGRPLFSPDSSRDSDMSSDSFASSIADSVTSDKHSSTGQNTSFLRPIATPSSTSLSSTSSDCTTITVGTVPVSEVTTNKKSKKKTPPKADNSKNEKKGSNTLVKGGGKVEKQPAKSKKRKGSNASNPGADTPSAAALAMPVLEYMCEWAGCKRCFDSAHLVFIHVTKTHVPPVPESLCQWEGCEPLQRKRWSLITHLQDHHCSEMAQRQACHRRFQAAQAAAAGGSAQSSNNPAPAPALVYPPDAALQAIKRFHIRPPFPEFSEQREGPVTKHIRLTAALILRNLARYSSHGRSLIKRWERQLSYVTMSAVESSTALSNCLWEILHDT